LCTSCANALVGLKSSLPEWVWYSFAFFLPFFWFARLMVTPLASGSVCRLVPGGMTLACFQNMMSCHWSGMVHFFCPFWAAVGVYLPTRRRKKYVVIMRSAVTLCFLYCDFPYTFAINRMVEDGSYCWGHPPSNFLFPAGGCSRPGPSQLGPAGSLGSLACIR
jgi:hypothetical protein